MRLHLHNFERYAIQSYWRDYKGVRWYYKCSCGKKRIYRLILQKVPSERTILLVEKLGARNADRFWAVSDWIYEAVPTRLRLRRVK